MTTEPTAAQRAELEATRGTADTLVQRDFTIADVLVTRAATEGSTLVDFYGHASVTGKAYEMYGGPDKGGWNETVDKGAFKRTLAANPDVPFKINHEGMNLARTKAGTMNLREDSVGLEVKATLDTRDTNVNNLVVQMEAGNIDEMSFAFRIRGQQWLNADGEEVPWWDMSGIDRHIQEVDIHKGDVSAVNYGANPFTDAALRAFTLADLRSLNIDGSNPDELREAISYLESLLPAPTLHPELVEGQHRAVARHSELRAALL